MDLCGKKVLIIGKKRSGIEASKLLSRQGATVYIYDDFDFSETEFNDIEDIDAVIGEIDFAVLSPAISFSSKTVARLKEADIETISELDLAYLCAKCKIIGVTGTNGKTTTVSMITHVLKNLGYNAYALGNIGIPFSSVADKLSQADIAVIEASSFQLEQSVCFTADVAAITNISPDHLNRHVNALNYYAVKTKLFSMQEEAGASVINYDDELCKNIHTRNPPTLYSYNKNIVDGLAIKESAVCRVKSGEYTPIMKIYDKSLLLSYNLQNVLCAIGCVINAVGDEIVLADTLNGFRCSKYRNQFTACINGAKIFNDSKSTNSGSCIASVSAMKGRLILIMGGQGKGEDYTDLLLKTTDKVFYYYLVGENAIDIFFKCKLLGLEYKTKLFANLYSAVEDAISQRVDAILFSPAAASFDHYADYEERGRVFDEIIKEFSE